MSLRKYFLVFEFFLESFLPVGLYPVFPFCDDILYFFIAIEKRSLNKNSLVSYLEWDTSWTVFGFVDEKRDVSIYYIIVWAHVTFRSRTLSRLPQHRIVRAFVMQCSLRRQVSHSTGAVSDMIASPSSSVPMCSVSKANSCSLPLHAGIYSHIIIYYW